MSETTQAQTTPTPPFASGQHPTAASPGSPTGPGTGASSGPQTGPPAAFRAVTGPTGPTGPTGSTGSGPTGSGGDRLPRPPGRRRPGTALLAVLLIVLGAATAGLLAVRLDTRSQVLVARHDISAGQLIKQDDLAVTKVAAEGVQLIPAGQADQVIGRYAASRITAGRLIDPGMVVSSGLLTSDKAAVGMALPSGRFPASGLESGDVVQVVRAVDGSGRVISAKAVIGSVSSPSSGVFGSEGSDLTVVTVVVPRGEAAAVAAAAAADQVSVVLLARGTALNER